MNTRPLRAIGFMALSTCCLLLGVLHGRLPQLPDSSPRSTSAAALEEAPESGQAAGLAVFHRSGQTFVTWREVNPPALGEHVTMAELGAARGAQPTRDVRYRLYRSTTPIESLAGQKPVAEVQQMSAWNAEFYGWSESAKEPAFRYVIEEGKGPIAPATGLFVHTPSKAENAYYAVTAVVNGKENRIVGPENSLRAPVAETVGRGEPVLQRVEHPDSFKYADRPTLHFYVRWESPPNSAASGRPFDYLVAVPEKRAKLAPAGLHLHCWGASLTSCSGWWFNAEQGAVHISSNQIPYDWWTGYHERIGTPNEPATATQWQAGVVRPYSQRRLLSFLDWAADRFQLDLTRTFAGGSSMGGTGALMIAIRHPERIAWAIGWVGVHVPRESPQFKSSFELVYGKPEWNVKFEDGTPVWDYYDDAGYLRKHPDRDLGFLTFSNGKNDSGIGWPQAVDFLRALQETRQPHMFVWGMGGHGERALMPAGGGERVMPLDLRVDQSLPAFTRSTLDDDPGNGDPSSGSPGGQVNRYITWDPASIVDEADRWEVTVRIVDGAPRGTATVDVTPRRLQRFKPSATDRIAWTNSVGRDRTPSQAGTITPDQWGLLTVPQMEIGTGKHRLQLRRAP